jgi:DNA-directed RNA polymerase subunit L
VSKSKIQFWLIQILLILMIIFVSTKITFMFKPIGVFFSTVFFPILITGFLYFLLNPLVNFLERKKQLKGAGYQVEYPWSDRPVLLVNGACVVGDNLESAVGNIINLTADFKKMPFSELKEVGKVVRQHVDTSRVIAFGGPYTSIEHILSTVHEKNPGQWGVDALKANVYGKGYEVYHMGYGVNIDGQFPMMLPEMG